MPHLFSPSAVTAARAELAQTSLDAIQSRTAFQWGLRAIAASSLGRPDVEIAEYVHEALEHAALADLDVRAFRKELADAIHAYRGCG